MNLCIFIRKEHNSLWILKCYFKRILSHRHNWSQTFWDTLIQKELKERGTGNGDCVSHQRMSATC